MKYYLILILLIVLSPNVLGAQDELTAFYSSQVIDRIDAIPSETVGLCKVEVDRGIAYYEDRINDRLQTLPLLMAVYSFIGVILAVFLGQTISLILHKNVRLRMLRLNTQILKGLKEIKGVVLLDNKRKRK